MTGRPLEFCAMFFFINSEGEKQSTDRKPAILAGKSSRRIHKKVFDVLMGQHIFGRMLV